MVILFTFPEQTSISYHKPRQIFYSTNLILQTILSKYLKWHNY
ncbi:Uncharacterized protein dnl_59540 [Desulfonema limicola]|uniref:Uncharacterized protein n=1 Tax=Desulfonema limicola TaxID=45656 RepID=A0A975BDV6_9BACT|nr:Uncharacterized protein dnl_59540 [Desulfonema limicola]